MSFTTQVSKRYNEQQQKECLAVGYYLVHSTGRHFISTHVNVASLERVCDNVLTKDYDYWIDYGMGKDVNGNIAWANMDYTDKFI